MLKIVESGKWTQGKLKAYNNKALEIVETKLCTSMSYIHDLEIKPCFCKKVLCWSALLLSLHKKFFLLCYIFYPFRLFEVEVISMTIIKNWELLPLKKKIYFFLISKFIDWTKERQAKVYEKEISIEFTALLFIFDG